MRSKRPKLPARFPCSSIGWGCGKRVFANEYNFPVHTCHACCREAARAWHVDVRDLDRLEVAINAAGAGKMGAPPTYEDVWAVLEKLGVQKHHWVPAEPKHLPPQGQVPTHEREDLEILF